MALMPKLFAPEDLAAMIAIRNALNPEGRCSPSKKLPSGGHCIERTSPGRRASA
jgi:glycolate oxidase